MGDDVQVSNPVPGPGLKDEDVPTAVTCVTAVDPVISFEPSPNSHNVLILSKPYREIDDRLGEQIDHSGRSDMLHTCGIVPKDACDVIPERCARAEPGLSRPFKS